MPNADDDYHGAEGCWLSGVVVVMVVVIVVVVVVVDVKTGFWIWFQWNLTMRPMCSTWICNYAICMSDQSSMNYVHFFLWTPYLGWGLVRPPYGMPNTLQKLQGKIWQDADLKKRWPDDMIQPGMIGFGTDHKSACMGDSGIRRDNF